MTKIGKVASIYQKGLQMRAQDDRMEEWQQNGKGHDIENEMCRRQ